MTRFATRTIAWYSCAALFLDQLPGAAAVPEPASLDATLPAASETGVDALGPPPLVQAVRTDSAASAATPARSIDADMTPPNGCVLASTSDHRPNSTTASTT